MLMHLVAAALANQTAPKGPIFCAVLGVSLGPSVHETVCVVECTTFTNSACAVGGENLSVRF